jgi:hypothetical protein
MLYCHQFNKMKPNFRTILLMIIGANKRTTTVNSVFNLWRVV